MSNAQIRTMEQYVELQKHIAGYHAIIASAKQGIFKALDAGQKTEDEIADICGMEVIPVRSLLGILQELSLIEKYDEHYALSQVTRLLPNLEQIEDPHWQRIAEWLRNSTETGLTNSEALEIHPDPQWMLTPAALDASKALDIGQTRKAIRVLEVAGGPCVLSATFAYKDPTSRFTLVDNALGLAQARETFASIDRMEQAGFIESDPLQPPCEANTFDLIIVPGVLRRIAVDVSKSWLTNLRDLLRPGGELAVFDWFPGQEKGTSNLVFSQFELSVKYRHGGLVSPQLLSQWLDEAGLQNVRFAELPAPPHIWGLVLSEKAGSPENAA